MNILRTYLFKDLIKPMLVALFIMLSIVWLMQSLRFMDMIVNKGLDMGTFLWITALIIPSLLIVILPLAVFTGGCTSFKRLNDNHELPALMAAGISKIQIVRPALAVALIVTAIGYLISLYLMPLGMRTFKEMQHDLRQMGGNLLLEEGTFNQIGNDMMVYVKKRNKNSYLKGLLVHDTRNAEKPVTWMASEGQITFNADGYPRLILKKGSRQEVTNQRLSLLEFEEHTLDITQQIRQPEKRWLGVEERYVPELVGIENLNEQQSNQFQAEVHKRLLWPLTPIPLTLLACVFLIRSSYNRHGITKQVIICSVIAVLYQAILMTSHNIASKGNSLVLLGQWLLPISVSLICLYILTKKEEYTNA
jgi:lipopolysaccharide export system permease protein